ncbi:SDR family NAD(P)-dependent oxidoreductase [Micromonospora sp. WMMD1102]|uniref:SDR family NAD(P)-dependent oxidoreductase n=1 Tax=Micromonospora sp. WMMD1102 TaxID=3016105 RepID=UPI002414ED9D|nr:SDR family NAD(P)-dependent oxidoreductase [Micromonospora sp. WMMD1102]MDG4786710.1 SDR family NAD(P)-dependent oxidoreductase [Micromonospora sp. WMMD1102]
MTDTPGRPLALVTGASTGIGYELAKEFARNGFDLVLVAENEQIRQAARDVEALGATVEAVQADLATPTGVQQAYDRVAATGRPLDALVVNAGIGVNGRFAESDLADELRLVDLNVRSAVHLAKLGIPPMVARGAGRVMFTSSIAATQPGPFEAGYAASKAFLLSFSEALHNELKDSGVTVTALMPGATETEFFDRADMRDTRLGAAPKDDPAKVARHGFEAMMAGRDHVVAGSVHNRLLAGAAKLVPERVKAELHSRLARPGSAKE